MLNEIEKLIAEAQNFGTSATERRHDLIKRMAAFYSEPSLRKTAEKMASDLQRYHQARWRRDKHEPPGYGEAKSAAMFQYMTASDGRLIGPERIREVLAGRRLGKS